MTDPVRGENPVWASNYKNKDRCLTAHTVINLEGVFRSPTTNKILKQWVPGDKLSVDWVITFNTSITCTQSPCKGPTSLLGPTCRDMFDFTNDSGWLSPPGETVGSAPYNAYLALKYKIGCCSKKCANKKGKTSVNLNFTLPGNIFTASAKFTENADGTGQVVRFDETDRSSNAIRSIMGNQDEEEFMNDLRDKIATEAGLKLNPQFSERQAAMGSTSISYYVEIIPGGLFDQNFERPCGE